MSLSVSRWIDPEAPSDPCPTPSSGPEGPSLFLAGGVWGDEEEGEEEEGAETPLAAHTGTGTGHSIESLGVTGWEGTR